MFLTPTLINRLVIDKKLEQLRSGGNFWSVPSPYRSNCVSSCRLVGSSPRGQAIVVMETLTGTNLVLSALYLQSTSTPTSVPLQDQKPIFKVALSAIIYHCSISYEPLPALLITFTSLLSPFSKTVSNRQQRLYDTILVLLSLQKHETKGIWPIFDATNDVEATMKTYGMKPLISGSPDPVIGYFFLSEDQYSGSANQSIGDKRSHISELSIDDVVLNMHRYVLPYFLTSTTPGIIADEYALPLTYCTFKVLPDVQISQTTIDKINVRFNQSFSREIHPFVTWHEVRPMGSLPSHMKEPVAFLQFLPTTRDLIVISKQKAGYQIGSIWTINLTLSLYKEHRQFSSLPKDSSTTIMETISPAFPNPSVQRLQYICSLCIGTFPEFLFLSSESHSALIPGTISVSFGSIQSTLPIVALEYILPQDLSNSAISLEDKTTTTMLTLVSPFTEAVHSISIEIDTDMQGLKMTGRDEDGVEPGAKKAVDATNFRLFSNAIASYVLGNTSMDANDSKASLDSLTFRIISRNTYRHSFLSICSTQLFFITDLIIWIVPDPKNNIAKISFISCSQTGGFHTMFMATEALLSIDLRKLFIHGDASKIPGSFKDIPSGPTPLSSSLFDVVHSPDEVPVDESSTPHAVPSDSNVLLSWPRSNLCNITEYSVSKSILKTKNLGIRRTTLIEDPTPIIKTPKSIDELDAGDDIGLTQSCISLPGASVSDNCLVTNVFSMPTHLIPIVETKISYIIILKELQLHRSSILLRCSSKRFVQLPSTAVGMYFCNCKSSVIYTQESKEGSRHIDCEKVRKHFQTVYFYDTYTCQLCSLTINYSNILKYLFSEDCRRTMRACCLSAKLLEAPPITIDGTIISHMDIHVEKLFVRIMLSISICAFFYFVGTLLLNCSVCPVRPYIAANVLSDLLNLDPSITLAFCNKDESRKSVSKRILANLMNTFMDCTFLYDTSTVPMHLVFAENFPIVLFSLLYCQSLYTAKLNPHEPAAAIAAHTFAAKCYHILMHSCLVAFESFRGFYQRAELPCNSLKVQCAFFKRLSQMDDPSFQALSVFLQHNMYSFQPQVLFIGKPDQGIPIHPLSRETSFVSCTLSKIADYYIHQQIYLRNFSKQVYFFNLHHFSTLTKDATTCIEVIGTDIFIRQIANSIDEIQASMQLVLNDVLSSYRPLWAHLFEVYELFVNVSYDASRHKPSKIPHQLISSALYELNGLHTVIPCEPAWRNASCSLDPYLYPCYRRTTIIRTPSEITQVEEHSRMSHCFDQPLSNKLFLLLEHAALRGLLIKESNVANSTILRLINLDGVKIPRTSLTKSRSRSRLRNQYGSLQSSSRIADNGDPQSKLIDVGQQRLKQIEEMLNQSLDDAFPDIIRYFLFFEEICGATIPKSVRPFHPIYQSEYNSDFTTQPGTLIQSTSLFRPGSRASSRTSQRNASTADYGQFIRKVGSSISTNTNINIPTSLHRNTHAQTPSKLAQFPVNLISECEGLDRSDIVSFLKYL